MIPSLLSCDLTHQSYQERPVIERFWKKVSKTENCWLWVGNKTGFGYGTIKADKRHWPAHRLSWFIHYGPLQEGMYVCHKCDIRHCVRPDHLFLGTQTDNVRDMEAKKRSKHPRGEDVGRSKLSEKDVFEIRKQNCHEKTVKEALSKKYGVCIATISHIATRRSWKHL